MKTDRAGEQRDAKGFCKPLACCALYSQSHHTAFMYQSNPIALRALSVRDLSIQDSHRAPAFQVFPSAQVFLRI